VDSADGLLKLKDDAGTVTAVAGTGLSDPMTTRGDIIVRNASNVTARLAVGSSGKVLSSDGTDVSWQTPSAGGTDPWFIQIDPTDIYATGHTTWNTLAAVNSVYFHGQDIQSGGAQNSEIYWDIGISAGTWDLQLTHSKGPNRGIYTVTLDATSWGTIDGYAASGSGVEQTRSALTSQTATGGKQRLKLKMATKNGSSSSYFGTIQYITLRRTA